MQIKQMVQGVEQLLAGLHSMIDLAPSSSTPFAYDIRSHLLDTQQSYPFLMDILIINPKNEIIQWTGPGIPPLVADREYVQFHQRRHHSETYIGPPLLSKVHHNRWFFAISTADYRLNELEHITVAIIDLDYLANSFRHMTTDNAYTFLIASEQGQIYLREPEGERFIGSFIKEIPYFLIKGTRELTMEMRSPLDNINRIFSGQKIDAYPLVTVVSTPIERALWQWRDSLPLLILGTLLLWFFLGILTWKLYQSQLQQYQCSIRDSLTQLCNRNYFIEQANHELARSQRYQTPITLLMIDLDHFKEVNDHYGHLAGDKVLESFSTLLRDMSRQHDLVGRYAGEEFIILLPETDLEGGHSSAEKILHGCRALDFVQHDLRDLRITCSIGMVSTVIVDLDQEKQTSFKLSELIRQADQELYHAKEGGRNRVYPP